MRLDKITPAVFGTAARVTINNKYTTIVNGSGEVEKISERCDQIKYDIDNAPSNYEKEQNQERLAKLAGGVAILRIGAESELEMKEKKDRVEDALNATRAALDEGVVPGGGTALMRCLDTKLEFDNADQESGSKIIAKACAEPFNTIMKNAGLNADLIWNKIIQKKDNLNTGYDARKEEVVDMYEAGIIDPAKVTRVALEKAASVAGTLLTTECVITNKPEEAGNEPPMAGGGFGMM